MDTRPRKYTWEGEGSRRRGHCQPAKQLALSQYIIVFPAFLSCCDIMYAIPFSSDGRQKDCFVSRSGGCDVRGFGVVFLPPMLPL